MYSGFNADELIYQFFLEILFSHHIDISDAASNSQLPLNMFFQHKWEMFGSMYSNPDLASLVGEEDRRHDQPFIPCEKSVEGIIILSSMSK